MNDRTPYERAARAYHSFRNDRASWLSFWWVTALAVGIVAVNLLIALTDEGRAVWAWFAGL